MKQYFIYRVFFSSVYLSIIWEAKISAFFTGDDDYQLPISGSPQVGEMSWRLKVDSNLCRENSYTSELKYDDTM